MALSDLVGAECVSCLKSWKSIAAFDRLEIARGIYCTEPSLDIPAALLPAVFWIVRCLSCGCEQRILWELE